MMNSKEINYEFKVLYALGMVFIVAGHCGNGGVSIGYEYFPPYAFHLALFMFASGYFYNSNSEKHIFKAIMHKMKKLVIPLYIWNFFYAFFVYFTKWIGFSIGGDISFYNLIIAPWVTGHQFAYNLGGWFVSPLFMIFIINILLRKILGKIFLNKDWIAEGIFLICGVGGIYAAKNGWNTGLYLIFARIAYFIPFYGAGIVYKNYLEKKDRLSNVIYFGIIFMAQLAIITIHGGTVSYVAAWCSGFGNVILPFVVGICGVAFWLRIAKILTPVLFKSKIVLLVADHTFSIMINQFLGFYLIKTIFALSNRYLHICAGFNWSEYFSDIWYYYLPKGLAQWYFVYLLSGIIVPIVIAVSIDKMKTYAAHILNKRKRNVNY